MSEETRAVLQDALAQYIVAQRDAIASGQDPAGVDRSAIEDAARVHLVGADDHDTLRDAYEALRDDPAADPQLVQAAAERLAAHRAASRIAEGRPITAIVGG